MAIATLNNSTPSLSWAFGALQPAGFQPLRRDGDESASPIDPPPLPGRDYDGAQITDNGAVAGATRNGGEDGVRPGGVGGALIDGGTAFGAQAQGQGGDQVQDGIRAVSEGEGGGTDGASGETAAEADEGSSSEASPANPDGLSEEEEEAVADLKQRDAEVRRHEQAHAAAGGQYAGAPTYSYQRGPDGRQYAVGGSGSIDTSPVSGDPEATIRKADIIKRAALAPAEPSGQDRQVAAQADALRQQAQAEINAERAEALREGLDGADSEEGAGEGAEQGSADGEASTPSVATGGESADTTPANGLGADQGANQGANLGTSQDANQGANQGRAQGIGVDAPDGIGRSNDFGGTGGAGRFAPGVVGAPGDDIGRLGGFGPVEGGDGSFGVEGPGRDGFGADSLGAGNLGAGNLGAEGFGESGFGERPDDRSGPGLPPFGRAPLAPPSIISISV